MCMKMGVYLTDTVLQTREKSLPTWDFEKLPPSPISTRKVEFGYFLHTWRKLLLINYYILHLFFEKLSRKAWDTPRTGDLR